MTQISIVVATFNSSENIESCLASIIAQDGAEKIEVVVVDGMSTDATIGVVRKFCDLFSNIKFISERDGGIYDAWNKGVRMSTGKWICFLGSDDVLLPNAVKELIAASVRGEETECNLVSFCVELMKDGKLVKRIGKEYRQREFLRYCSIAHVGALHSRTLILDAGGFDERYRVCGDYDLLLRSSDSIKAYFRPVAIAQMSLGGISNNSNLVIWETLRAKLRSTNRSRVLIFIEAAIAAGKFFVRRALAH